MLPWRVDSDPALPWSLSCPTLSLPSQTGLKLGLRAAVRVGACLYVLLKSCQSR